jgi:NAD(P)-dependent dehydrogenase (short-subunit alcohol dehydrogenase family)
MSTQPGTEFTGKAVFVTGAGSGIGAATALAFATQGADIALVGRTRESVDAVAEQVRQHGVRALSVAADVTQADEVEAAVAATVTEFGRLDYAFNNARIEQPAAPAADISVAEWERLIATDLSGVFYGMKYQIPHILNAGGGAIVNTSSGAGVVGIAGQAAYAAAKWGVIGLSKSTALDYAAQNLRVNVVAPGIIATPMMDRFSGGTAEGREKVIGQEPVGRMGRPEEIASAVLWLCSDLGSFTTGHTLVVDGGQTVGLS